MIRLPPIATRTDTPFPYTTSVRSPTTTLPPGPLLSGRSEATDETQPSSDEKASARGDKPASGDPKLIPVPRSQDSQSPRERAERDLLEGGVETGRSEEHQSELQPLMRTSSAVFCLKKKKKKQ